MSFSVYEITVPVMLHGLGVMGSYLDHAEILERSKGAESGSLLQTRLAPDMLTLGEQFTVGCNKVDAHICKLMQRGRPTSRAIAISYSAIKQRLIETRDYLQSLQPEELAAAQSHTYELSPPIVRGWFSGDDYIRHLVLPDFFFHIATIHGILRHLGAPIGKRDYLGNLAQQSGGDYS